VYATVPLASVIAEKKRVDVGSLYDAQGYRPRVREVLGKPMFFN
jgi:6-phosphofructokinase 1